MTMTGFCSFLDMHRFHFPHPVQPGTTVELDRDESHHAARVLRLAIGDAVELLDGCGHVACGSIASLGRGVRVSIAQVAAAPPPSPRIDIASAIPKGPRADAMVEQLSQLGVNRLIPLRSRRSVVDPRDTKIEKFQRAAIESAKQCGRAWFMQVDQPTDFASLLGAKDHGVRLLADPGGTAMIAADAFSGATPGVDAGTSRNLASALILIGPEGGFTDEERAEAIAAGCLPWSLGPHILRIETAAVAAAAVAGHAFRASGFA